MYNIWDAKKCLLKRKKGNGFGKRMDVNGSESIECYELQMVKNSLRLMRM